MENKQVIDTTCISLPTKRNHFRSLKGDICERGFDSALVKCKNLSLLGERFKRTAYEMGGSKCVTHLGAITLHKENLLY